MFYPTGEFITVVIYIGAAILPAIFLMRYVYKLDRVEREPKPLLFSLILMGLCAAGAAYVIESLAGSVLNFLIEPGSFLHTVILAFVVVAASEEGAKFFFLKKKSWNDENFNYSFDGIVYSVFVSLGFAAVENIIYIFSYGLSIALARALLAIPAHMGFSVFMGVFYGKAKKHAECGNYFAAKRNLRRGYLSAVLLHGFYDTCAMISTSLSNMIFLGFVIIMYIVVIRLIKREANFDEPV